MSRSLFTSQSILALFKRLPGVAGGKPRDSEKPAFEVDLGTVQEQMRRIVPGKTAVDLSLSLSDGRALPDWLVLSQKRVLLIKKRPLGDIVLSMTLFYDDGQVSRFELTITAKSTPLKLRVKQAGAVSQALLFSDQLSYDEPLEALYIPLAA